MPKTHGMSKTKVYRAWSAMKARCFTPSPADTRLYRDRGITVYPGWLGEGGFERFYACVGDPPSNRHSLDRFPNRNGNYEPRNVRWATKRQQAQNVSCNVEIEFDGRVQCAAVWAEELGIKYHTLYARIAKGWSPDKALMTRPTKWTHRKGKQQGGVEYRGEVKSVRAWCEELGIPYARTWRRIEQGWSVVDAFTLSNQRPRKRVNSGVVK